MIVYVLMKYVQYESGDCLGVFSKREHAEKIKGEIAEECWAYDYEVEEFTVDDTARACSGHVHRLEP